MSVQRPWTASRALARDQLFARLLERCSPFAMCVDDEVGLVFATADFVLSLEIGKRHQRERLRVAAKVRGLLQRASTTINSDWAGFLRATTAGWPRLARAETISHDSLLVFAKEIDAMCALLLLRGPFESVLNFSTQKSLCVWTRVLLRWAGLPRPGPRTLAEVAVATGIDPVSRDQDEPRRRIEKYKAMLKEIGDLRKHERAVAEFIVAEGTRAGFPLDSSGPVRPWVRRRVLQNALRVSRRQPLLPRRHTPEDRADFMSIVRGISRDDEQSSELHARTARVGGIDATPKRPYVLH